MLVPVKSYLTFMDNKPRHCEMSSHRFTYFLLA
jgi:hypothetical protein